MFLKSVPRASRQYFLLIALLILAVGQAIGQPQSTELGKDADAAIDAIGTALDKLQARKDGNQSAEDLGKLSEKIAEQQHQADLQVAALQPQLDQANERLGQLGQVAPGATEAPDIAAQRKQLQADHDRIDGAIKRARLLSVEAQQLEAQIEKARAQQLGEELFHRSESPLSVTLWRDMAQAVPEDLHRVGMVWRQFRSGVSAAVAEQGWAAPVVGSIIALFLLVPGSLLLRWIGRRYAVEHAPGSRLRRSGLAVWGLVVGTVMPWLAAWVLIQSLRSIDVIAADSELETLASGFVSITGIAAFVGAVSASLLLPKQPSWRLLPFDDVTATKLGRYAWLTSVAVWVCSMSLLVSRVAGTGMTTRVAMEGVVALIYVGLIIAILVSLLRIHRGPVIEASEQASADAPATEAPRRSSVVVLISLLAQLVIATALIAALLGYVNFAWKASSQIIWTVVICGAGGLLMMFTDDMARWLFRPDSRFGKSLNLAVGLRASHMEQAGVLVSAVLRLWLLVMLLAALLAPFGANVSGIYGWFGQAWQGGEIAGVSLKPSNILLTILVVVVGLGILRGFQGWLTGTYLPKTELDVSTRTSIASVTRYLGIATIALWSLTTLGFDLKNLAMLASALSVGIGFGLQAITQNFISGLILMAERPVKIGDWVRIGDAEGDIRRINVRSTEIQVGDKSTLIVPNSELITKTIRNMTMANPLGRVQLKFSVPLGTDLGRVRALLLELYEAHAGVLDEPAPSVFIDSIDAGLVSINSYCYVSGPRAVYGTRSDLFFQLLQALSEENIALATPQDVRIIAMAPQSSTATASDDSEADAGLGS